MAKTNKIPADYGSEDLQDSTDDSVAALHARVGTQVVPSKTRSNGDSAIGGRAVAGGMRTRGGNI